MTADFVTLQSASVKFLKWLRASALENAGIVPQFSRVQANKAMGIEHPKHGMKRGQIHSRVDFACYELGLPPLGLLLSDPYLESWKDDENIRYHAARMVTAARTRTWAKEEFDSAISLLSTIYTGSGKLWADEARFHPAKLQLWADSFLSFDEWKKNADDKPSKNAVWSRDELILALHLYLCQRDTPISKKNSAVTALSELLNAMARATITGPSYRSESSIYMKLMNYRSIDPRYISRGKVGLTRNNKDEKVVWDLFANSFAKLEDIVAAIHSAIDGDPSSTGIGAEDEEDIVDCEEGRILTRMHRYRERNRELVKKFKMYSKKKSNEGMLKCAACDLDYIRKYGPFAETLIDVHHIKPVHTMLPGNKTSVKDLVLLCASCHRAVHSQKKWLSVSELRSRLFVNAG